MKFILLLVGMVLMYVAGASFSSPDLKTDVEVDGHPVQMPIALVGAALSGGSIIWCML